ncbi:cysteine protease [Streptomyces phage Sycamore]|uniref:Cysteine protease n=1 Tax=Streptomyces phage Sycamore TaxID=2767589 RepID=A0A873WPK1_9CAUD|nr:cysteine protease [Streptomyces phage Sycamore]
MNTVSWVRRIPIHTQGRTGSCTGHTLAGILGTDSTGRKGSTSVSVTADPFGVFTAGRYPLDELFAVRAYSLATRLDNISGDYPRTDTGSNGLGAAKAATALGLLADYAHVRSLDALKDALQSGPVMWGTFWYQSMFRVDRRGFLNVDKSSRRLGGHELIISGYSPERDYFTIQNSWGPRWAVKGFAFVSGADMAWLLSQYADITVPVFPR